MNTDRSPRPAEWRETEGLLPPAERDLPVGRHEFHKERLMAQIHDETRTTAPAAAPARPQERRGWFRRPAIVLPLAACALAGVIATSGVLAGQDGTDGGTGLIAGPVLTTEIGSASATGTVALLDRISLAAAESPAQEPRADQFLYVESTTAGTHVRTSGDEHTVVSKKPHRRQVWQSPDGRKGWLIEPGVSPEGGETLDSPHGSSSSWDILSKLPTDPDALLKKVYAESEGQGNSRDQAAFSAIGDLLGESYPPSGLEAALYKAAAKIPGVVKVDSAVDAEGREGIAVARLDNVSGEREEWIFEEKTLAFLGTRHVQVTKVENPNPEDLLIKPGTVTHTSAVTSRAIVDGIKQTPTRAS
ncbi:CU044_5270 family protein [Streptomyces sp. NBC_01716]|uniref:CU044_5270 family protein n=1 Tax=Streptomyces sp. NBC_01716 TaxID=2975917 RepID=UPI002E2ED0D7|nr:CU044_5270 family protein [Streptomyces sp. NBC_01716]